MMTAVIISFLPALLYAGGYSMLDGQPLVLSGLPPITPELTFVATGSTLVASCFMGYSALRVTWAHIDQTAQTMTEVREAREEAQARQEKAVRLADFANELLNISSTESLEKASRAIPSRRCSGAHSQSPPNEQPSPGCLLYTSPSPRDATLSRMPSSA